MKAIRSLKELVDWRRDPQRSAPPSQPSDDVYEALVDLMIELFEQAGLYKVLHRYAIRMRIIGMTDDGAGDQRGIKEPSFRRDVSAAHAALGTEGAYALLRRIAIDGSAAIQRTAALRGCSVETILAELRTALLDQRAA